MRWCVSSPWGLCVGLGLSSTTDCMSGWSLTTMRGGRSLLRTSELCWLSADVLPDFSSSASLSVSDASPGTWRHPCKITDKADSEQVRERRANTGDHDDSLRRTPWHPMWQAGEQTWRWCRPHRQSPSQTPRPAPLSGTCWTWLHRLDVTSFVS